MLARLNFDGEHVWHNRRTVPQDSRARLAGRARRGRVRGQKFEVFGTANPELRTSDHAFLACLVTQAPRSLALAEFFSILGEEVAAENHERTAEGETQAGGAVDSYSCAMDSIRFLLMATKSERSFSPITTSVRLIKRRCSSLIASDTRFRMGGM